MKLINYEEDTKEHTFKKENGEIVVIHRRSTMEPGAPEHNKFLDHLLDKAEMGL